MKTIFFNAFIEASNLVWCDVLTIWRKWKFTFTFKKVAERILPIYIKRKLKFYRWMNWSSVVQSVNVGIGPKQSNKAIIEIIRRTCFSEKFQGDLSVILMTSIVQPWQKGNVLVTSNASSCVKAKWWIPMGCLCEDLYFFLT